MTSNNIRLRIEDALAYLCRSNVGNFYAMTVNSLEGAGTILERRVEAGEHRIAMVLVEDDGHGNLA